MARSSIYYLQSSSSLFISLVLLCTLKFLFGSRLVLAKRFLWFIDVLQVSTTVHGALLKACLQCLAVQSLRSRPIPP